MKRKMAGRSLEGAGVGKEKQHRKERHCVRRHKDKREDNNGQLLQ